MIRSFTMSSFAVLVRGGILALLTSVAQAQVAVNADSTAKKTGAGTLSWSHTVSAGSNRMLVVGVVTDGVATKPSSVTWGGVALSNVGFVSNAQGGDSDKRALVSVWTLVAPASGTNTVAATLTGGSAVVAGATSYTGVDQTTPYTGWTTTTGSSLNSSLTQPAGSGLFVDFIGVFGGGVSVTPLTQTQRWKNSTGNQDNDSIGGSSSKSTAGTTSWQLGSAKAWAAAGLWLKAASAGTVGLKITYSNTGLYCLSQTVTISPVDSFGVPISGYTGTVLLSTTSARGTWTLAAGLGTLTDSVPDDGAASYVWNGADSSATFALSYRAGAAIVTVNGVDSLQPSIADDGTQGAITFSPSGFTVTSAPFSNPAGGVPGFASPQVAGNNVSVYLTAYGQSPTDPTCGIITSYAGNKSLKLWSDVPQPRQRHSCAERQRHRGRDHGSRFSVADRGLHGRAGAGDGRI